MRALIGLGLGVAFAATPLSDTQRLAAQQASAVTAADDPWTREELENLLAPIALYPDPILAQVLIAATYPDQVQAASAYVQRYGTDGLDNQPWEISVKAVAHYAPVLNLMAEGEDWMVALGQAYAEQPRDVMDAVQSLRRMANAQGNLVSTEQQKVIVEREVIRIEPAQPRVVYVPTYDPAVVYFRPIHVVHAHPAYWAWGVGFPIGVWLTYDVDWWGHRVYHHGWHTRGPRWVVVSRPWVVISPIYVAPRHTTIIVNRTIVHRRFDPRPLRRYTVVHKHTTFDRRGVPRRDVGRDDRRDWDRGRDTDRRDWDRGRDTDRRDADRGRGNNGRNEGNPGRGDERRDWNRGNGNVERRATPVPVGGTRVADRSRVAPSTTPSTTPSNGRRVTPIASGARPVATAPAQRPGATRSERRAVPQPAAAPRTSGGYTGTPSRGSAAPQGERRSTPQAVPRPQGQPQASIPGAAQRAREARPSGNGGALSRRGSAPARPGGSGSSAAPSRGSGGGSAAPARGASSGGRSAAPAGGGSSGGRSAAPARSGSSGGRSAAPARSGGGGSSQGARGSGRRGGD